MVSWLNKHFGNKTKQIHHTCCVTTTKCFKYINFRFAKFSEFQFFRFVVNIDIHKKELNIVNPGEILLKIYLQYFRPVMVES